MTVSACRFRLQGDNDKGRTCSPRGLRPRKGSRSGQVCSPIVRKITLIEGRPMTTTYSKVRRFTAGIGYSLLAVAILGGGVSRGIAQEMHSHKPDAAETEQARRQQDQSNELVKIVRQSTERFKDVAMAKAEGYALMFGCVSGDSSGAM